MPMMSQQAKLKLPVNEEVPSGLGCPVLIERRPAVLQLQGHFGV